LSKALFLIAITQAYGFMASVTARKKLLFTTVWGVKNTLMQK
jgi:hypothetical protein